MLWAAGILGDIQWKQLPLRCGVLARNQSNCEQSTKEQCHRDIERERGFFKVALHGFLLPGKNFQWKPSINRRYHKSPMTTNYSTEWAIISLSRICAQD